MPLAGLTTIGAELELLAGDPVAAEAEARRGLAVVEGSGLEVELLPLVAEALIAQGREAEAEPLLADADADADAHSIPWQVRLRTARARLLVSRGEVASALEEARAAVERAALLDDVNLSADAYAALAYVLEASGRAGEASAAREEAHDALCAQGERRRCRRSRGVAPCVHNGRRRSYRQRRETPNQEVGIWPRVGSEARPTDASHGAIPADSTVRSRMRYGSLRRRTAPRTNRSS